MRVDIGHLDQEQEAGGRRQEARGKGQGARGKGQEAGGRRQEAGAAYLGSQPKLVTSVVNGVNQLNRTNTGPWIVRLVKII